MHNFIFDVIEKNKDVKGLNSVAYKNGYIYIKNYDGKYFNIIDFKDYSFKYTHAQVHNSDNNKTENLEVEQTINLEQKKSVKKGLLK